MKEVKYTQTKFVSRDGESFDCKEECKRHEQHLDWLEINKKKFGEDFEFSALKNEKFNYFYHSKLGIIKDITEKENGVWTLPELEDEFLDEIVAQIVFTNQDRCRVPKIYKKIYDIFTAIDSTKKKLQD